MGVLALVAIIFSLSTKYNAVSKKAHCINLQMSSHSTNQSLKKAFIYQTFVERCGLTRAFHIHNFSTYMQVNDHT